MKKSFTFLFIVFGFLFTARADHITGGQMSYTLTGSSNGVYTYRVTMKLFMRCNSGRQFNDPTIFSIFNKSTGSRVSDINVPLSSKETINLGSVNPCITNPPAVCYEVGYFIFDVSLPGTPAGYIIASQVNYRIANINNLQSGYSQIGALYTADIPGMSPVSNAPQNNSAQFIGSDLVIVCANNSFSYSFAATDPDGDGLRYSFCDAYQSSSGGAGATASATSAPPYQSVPYGSGFVGTVPLGNSVQINQGTGLITGLAPAAGIYVVTVCVEEIRNGVVIATQRKDLQINIAPCDIAAAMLQPEYMLCRTTKSISLSNLSTSPLINSYLWEIVNNAGATIFTGTMPTVSFTFPDTGVYTIKLAINRGQQCSDSTKSIARVYPGFIPKFNFNGICFLKPTVFTDATTSVYGTVNSWSWDFGESTVSSDISTNATASYTYPVMGIKNVLLTAGNSKGCIDTVTQILNIVDKPPIILPFKDTLICLRDSVQLHAVGGGNFNWAPSLNIINANTPDPTVYPLLTTTYFVSLDDNGCLNRDSVRVRVVDHVSLQAMNDTTICQGDAIQLRIFTNGFQFSWTPASQLANPDIQNPTAISNFTTVYQVTASIGNCSSSARVIVQTIPYPLANAGNDTVICYGTATGLSGSMDGNAAVWSPATTLNHFNILNPVATPFGTTSYILSAFDTQGCPKPGRDTVTVVVLPNIHAYAGRDTSIVSGQPLQLNATGGMRYIWSPTTGLSATNIANPVAVLIAPSNGTRYKVFAYNQAGCVDSAFVTVRVFKTLPSVFVPTAFTPNNDGKNDILKPIPVGMKDIEYFNIYNRWGQLVFSSSLNGAGWDGKIGGRLQATGTFVWAVKATDYRGESYFEKGIVTVIR